MKNSIKKKVTRIVNHNEINVLKHFLMVFAKISLNVIFYLQRKQVLIKRIEKIIKEINHLLFCATLTQEPVNFKDKNILKILLNKSKKSLDEIAQQHGDWLH